MPQRHYTRADVEAEFNTRFSTVEDQKWEIKEVYLLPEITPPTWLIWYSVTYRPGKPDEHINFDHTIFVEKYYQSEDRYLNGPSRDLLPAGYATVQEEDAEIERRNAAELEAYRKELAAKHEAEWRELEA